MREICGLKVVKQYYSHRNGKYMYWVRGRLDEIPIELEIYGDAHFICNKVQDLLRNAKVLEKLIPVLLELTDAKVLMVGDDNEHGANREWWWFCRGKKFVCMSIRGTSVALAYIDSLAEEIRKRTGFALVLVKKPYK